MTFSDAFIFLEALRVKCSCVFNSAYFVIFQIFFFVVKKNSSRNTIRMSCNIVKFSCDVGHLAHSIDGSTETIICM